MRASALFFYYHFSMRRTYSLVSTNIKTSRRTNTSAGLCFFAMHFTLISRDVGREILSPIHHKDEERAVLCFPAVYPEKRLFPKIFYVLHRYSMKLERFAVESVGQSPDSTGNDGS